MLSCERLRYFKPCVSGSSTAGRFVEGLIEELRVGVAWLIEGSLPLGSASSRDWEGLSEGFYKSLRRAHAALPELFPCPPRGSAGKVCGRGAKGLREVCRVFDDTPATTSRRVK